MDNSFVWHPLKNEVDIENLMQVFGQFHDSCLKQVFIRTREYVGLDLAMGFDNSSVVRMIFQRQFHNPSAIELHFEDVQDMNWRHDNAFFDPGLSVIFQAVLQLEQGLIYWAEDEEWIEAGEDRNEFRWIAARKAKWRIIENGLGEEDILA